MPYAVRTEALLLGKDGNFGGWGVANWLGLWLSCACCGMSGAAEPMWWAVSFPYV